MVLNHKSGARPSEGIRQSSRGEAHPALRTPSVTVEHSEARVDAPPLSVMEISDLGSFLDLEPVWDSLVQRAGICHPFLTHTWVRTWWECFGGANELRILAVQEGDEIIALAPLMKGPGQLYGLNVLKVRSLSNDHSPRFDFILTRRAEESLDVIWNHLLQRGDWDVLELQQVPESATTLQSLPKMAKSRGLRTGLWSSANSPYLPILGAWEDYHHSLSGKYRSTQRSRLKHLTQLGEVALEVISSTEEVQTALEEGLRIEASGWKGEVGTAISSRTEVHRFYSRLAERAAPKGWLRLHFLRAGARRIAFDYCLLYANRLYLLKPAYDPGYARYSPYNLLCERVIQQAFQDHLEEFDFLGTDEEWKLSRTRRTRNHYWLFAFANSVRGRILHLAKFELVPGLRKSRMYLHLRDQVLEWMPTADWWRRGAASSAAGRMVRRAGARKEVKCVELPANAD